MSATVKLTESQRLALQALREHNGTGVRLPNGTILAGGEILGRYMRDELISAFSAITWSQLMGLGLVVADGPKRIRIAEGKTP